MAYNHPLMKAHREDKAQKKKRDEEEPEKEDRYELEEANEVVATHKKKSNDNNIRLEVKDVES